MRKNFLEEEKNYKEEINKYFNSYIPIKFDKLQQEYNIIIYGYDFTTITKIKGIDKKIVSMISFKEDEIKLYYNNNYNLDVKEQRFILANLVGELEKMKSKEKRPILKEYDFILKCDEPFDNMNMEEHNEYLCNNIARQILMPKKLYDKLYTIFSNNLEEEKLIELLSTLFVVPKREVIIRGKELGYNFDIDYLNAKTRKLV